MFSKLLTAFLVGRLSFAMDLTDVDEADQRVLVSPTVPSPVLNSNTGSETTGSITDSNKKMDKMNEKLQAQNAKIKALKCEVESQAERIATYEDITFTVQEDLARKDAEINALKQSNQASFDPTARADSGAADSEIPDARALLREVEFLKRKLKQETAQRERAGNEATQLQMANVMLSRRLRVADWAIKDFQELGNQVPPTAFPVGSGAAAAAPLPVEHDDGGYSGKIMCQGQLSLNAE